jgi:hypothetical protein
MQETARLVVLFAAVPHPNVPGPQHSRQRHLRIGPRVAPGTGPGRLAGSAVTKKPLNPNHVST